MNQDQEKKDLKKYYTYNLTLLQLMSLLAVVGIAVTLIIHYFF